MYADNGYRLRWTVRAGVVPQAAAGTSWGNLGSARQCVECMAASGVAMRTEDCHHVGARQRPNLGATQLWLSILQRLRPRWGVHAPCRGDSSLAHRGSAREPSAWLRSELHEQQTATGGESGPCLGQAHHLGRRRRSLGLYTTFQSASGHERAEHHQRELQRRGVPHPFRQELSGGWTLRLGPIGAIDVAVACRHSCTELSAEHPCGAEDELVAPGHPSRTVRSERA